MGITLAPANKSTYKATLLSSPLSQIQITCPCFAADDLIAAASPTPTPPPPIATSPSTTQTLHSHLQCPDACPWSFSRQGYRLRPTVTAGPTPPLFYHAVDPLSDPQCPVSTLRRRLPFRVNGQSPSRRWSTCTSGLNKQLLNSRSVDQVTSGQGVQELQGNTRRVTGHLAATKQ